MNRKLIRNLTIFAALIAIAFIAKMEAINFLLAFPLGVAIMVYVYQFQKKIYQRVEITLDEIPSRILSLVSGLVFAMYRWRADILIPLLAGVSFGYAIYSLLNALFISP